MLTTCVHLLIFGRSVRAAWCAEVNAAVHSEISAVPAKRLVTERELLGPLPSLRPSIGKMTTRKVDRLSCVRPGIDLVITATSQQPGGFWVSLVIRGPGWRRGS